MEEIAHSGIVRSVDGREVTVEILSKSACAACHAAGLCTASDMAVKLIHVQAEGFAPGESVDVVLERKLGMKAVLLAYVIPVLILLAGVVGLMAAGWEDWQAGLAAVAGLAVWCLILWLLRGRLSASYAFAIRRRLIN